jgi:hypothetical protein
MTNSFGVFERRAESKLLQPLAKRTRSSREPVRFGSKGYLNTNSKPSPYNQQPVYNGYLSVELKGKDSEILWSCLVTPSTFQWNGVTQDLVNRLAKKLRVALQQNGSLRH